nr:MAG TPA: hypothetical protein [Caudoviricetes sp.]
MYALLTEAETSNQVRTHLFLCKNVREMTKVIINSITK